MPRPDTAVRPPQQRRSQQTLDRILHATERLLQNREFDGLSVQEIVRASRTSVGSFYNRFRDKQSLLAGLYDRYDAGLGEWISVWRSRQGAPPADLTQAAAWVTRYLIEMFHSRRHLLRALALYVRTHPDDQDEGTKAKRASQFGFLATALLEYRDQFRHPEPERAAEAAVFGAASICRERILFSESAHASATKQTEQQLLHDVTRMMVGLLRPDAGSDFCGI